VFLSLFYLAGCASNSNQTKQEQADQATFESREKMLLSARNTKSLIDFYKNELVKKESEALKIKLVEAYIEDDDAESAAFHLSMIDVNDSNAADMAFLKAKLNLAQGNIMVAYIQNQTALSQKEAFPEAENLMGLIMAEKGDLAKAREYFLLSKQHYYDDVIINNNLAVIDLIEGKFDAVSERLMPIYYQGNADRRIKSNLVLALAKQGQYKPVETILKEQGYKPEQIQMIFISLRGAVGVSIKSETLNDFFVGTDMSAQGGIDTVRGENNDVESE